MPLGYNRVLGDKSKLDQTRPHRVALGHWPAIIEDPRTRTFEALINHTVLSGYEGVEFAMERLLQYFPGDRPSLIARKVRHLLEQANLPLFGSTLKTPDEMLRQLHWIDAVIEEMKLVQDMGGEYASIQFFLHDDYLNTGGAYRVDERYLRWCADRVSQMREAAWALGMNFYLEVHFDRITEDPAACCRILELVTCELNGDMSHYLYRNITRGEYVDTVFKHIGHTHVRMARVHGDISAEVEDPKADWQQGGVTWEAFKFMKPALESGLSSRSIVGETGPMHLVKDSLTQDAALIGLYRAMARYADASAQGIAMKVDSPDDLRPWG